MKKPILACLCALALAGCQESLDDRASRETREFTEKSCPMPIDQMRTLDSLTFDRSTRTFSQYETISGVGDDPQHFARIGDKLREELAKQLHFDTQKRKYKEAGYNYRYVMRSRSDGSALFDVTIGPDDYS